MPEEILETPQPTESKPLARSQLSSGRNLPKVILVAVFGFALLAGAAYGGYWYGIQQTQLPLLGQAPTSTPTLESKLDPSKPTTDCEGNYLYYRGVYEYANILEKIYDMNELKGVAVSKGFGVTLTEDQPFSYKYDWDVGKFNEEHELGFELKRGDKLEKGPVKIEVNDAGVVKITGPSIRIRKVVSDEEEYSIFLVYEPVYHLKQSIQVNQWGRCNFKDSYIKSQVKDFLEQLSIESKWVDEAVVEVGYMEPPAYLPSPAE